ncbi:hypothetical protein EKK58_00165 [Candidatus Dependentiae bacterium]|nr:MAG: hypothetical protein EKK58_00165 [Candidatus Dependentiae bacterium]
MNSATKQADWANHILPYAGVGSGAFALGALLNEVRRQQASEQQRKRQQLPPNALVIDLPRQAKAAEEKFYKQASGVLEGLVDHTLSAAIGAPIGFMGTKLLYDKYKKNQTDQEISAANVKYLRALQALQQKSAEVSTPHVDNFCKSAAETMSKVAGPLDLLRALGGRIGSAAKSVGTHIGAHPAAYAGGAGLGTAAIADAIRQRSGGAVPGTIGGLGDTAKKLLATTAILSGLGTAGAMINANNKRENKAPTTPTAVALNYEDLPPAATMQ